MTCDRVTLPGGVHAIVCRTKRRCKCGAGETLLCDWKVPTKKSGTCDRSLCASCATEVGLDKHLCPSHADEWQARLQARRNKVARP